MNKTALLHEAKQQQKTSSRFLWKRIDAMLLSPRGGWPVGHRQRSGFARERIALRARLRGCNRPHPQRTAMSPGDWSAAGCAWQRKKCDGNQQITFAAVHGY